MVFSTKQCMKYLLQTKFHFQEWQIVMLTDDALDPNYQVPSFTIFTVKI